MKVKITQSELRALVSAKVVSDPLLTIDVEVEGLQPIPFPGAAPVTVASINATFADQAYVARQKGEVLADFAQQVRNPQKANKIALIKAARTLTGMSLRDAKDFIENTYYIPF
jgi:ribosomal protein L7/L12